MSASAAHSQCLHLALSALNALFEGSDEMLTTSRTLVFPFDRTLTLDLRVHGSSPHLESHVLSSALLEAGLLELQGPGIFEDHSNLVVGESIRLSRLNLNGDV